MHARNKYMIITLSNNLQPDPVNIRSNLKIRNSSNSLQMRKDTGYVQVSDICLTPAALTKRPSFQFSSNLQQSDIVMDQKKKVKFEMLQQKKQFDQDDQYSNTITNISNFTQSEAEISVSDIIKNISDLKSLLDLNIGSYFLRKVFKASEHNFNVKKFHELCEGIQNTVVIAEISNGNIVGGYTPLTWNDEYEANATHYKTDKQQKSFIFNFTSKEKYPIVNQTNNKAIVGCQYLGPTFGGGYDFSIGNFANKRYSSSCDFPTSYSKKMETKNIKLTRRSLIGVSEQLFLVKQWEVFEILLKNKTTQIETAGNQLKQKNKRDSENQGMSGNEKGYWLDVIGFFTGNYKNKN